MIFTNISFLGIMKENHLKSTLQSFPALISYDYATNCKLDTYEQKRTTFFFEGERVNHLIRDWCFKWGDGG